MTVASFAAWVFMNSMLLLDWGQTRTIAMERTQGYTWSNPDGSGGTIYGGKPKYTEINPILGDHPSVGRVNRYFAASLVINNAVYFLLPEKWRNYYALGVGTIEAGFVLHNNFAGVRISW